MFAPVIERQLFSELFGFVICDPLKLEAVHGEPILGQDLLAQYSSTDLGERVAMEGAAIPVQGVEAGYYSIVLRDAVSPSLLAEAPSHISTGWILEVVSGQIAVCGLGALSHWAPASPAVRHMALPIGWYGVELWVGAMASGDDDYALEIILSRSSSRPRCMADVSQQLPRARRPSDTV
ncbi:MAG: hypothetical protein ABWY06_17770 [Pseudomonas sp.]|uniref:hypothetical protein n=1 Tax=Pseudomonas sp. TaxID=306 RepID=UPI003399DD39